MAYLLQRKVGEAVIIGEGDDRVRVEVVDRGRARLTLAIDAPREVLVQRAEVADDDC